MEAQLRDPYVRRAHAEGWRSRAAFKLDELLGKDRLIREGMTVVDLGAAPGGWSQYAAGMLAGNGRVIALDILPMEPIGGVEFVLGDFTEAEPLDELLGLLGDRRPELVMSDMAPNMSGIRSVDQPRAMYLAELALDFADRVLAPGGDFLVKLFHGQGFEEFLSEVRRRFGASRTRKPPASRSRSREVYLVARDFRGAPSARADT